MTVISKDREEAGRELARRIAGAKLVDPVITALPSGGALVGFGMAQALPAPLDVVLVRNIRASNPADTLIGTVVDAPEVRVSLLHDVIADSKLSQDHVQEATVRQLEAIDRLRKTFRRGHNPLPLAGRSVVLVDDGSTPAAITEAILSALRDAGVADLLFAAPVMSQEARSRAAHLADEVVCLEETEMQHPVSEYFQNSPPVSDDDVIERLLTAGEADVLAGRDHRA